MVKDFQCLKTAIANLTLVSERRGLGGDDSRVKERERERTSYNYCITDSLERNMRVRGRELQLREEQLAFKIKKKEQMEVDRKHRILMEDKRFELDKNREDNQALIVEGQLKAMTALQKRD